MSDACKRIGIILAKKKLSPSQIRTFREKVYEYYCTQGRDLPWRKTRNPYRILVSEIMLQQTQVDRVIEKYKAFLAAFPDFKTLTQAPRTQLLSIWSGLGYNRRALALQALAQQVMTEHRGKLPNDPEKLIELPGIGKYTAGAIAAFAFNKPVVFMDTNIRRVFIHEFFLDKENIKDEDIMPLIEQALDKEDSRTWYNALMDYGSMLKQTQANPNRKSAHYTKQSPFENSNRQVRGAILKLLVKEAPLTAAQIVKKSKMDKQRVQENLLKLAEEGFIRKQGRAFAL
jgi:A/G-specific adenine glycosylase